MTMDLFHTEVSEKIASASINNQLIHIKGSGSKNFYGNVTPAGHNIECIDMSPYQGIISYIPAELVLKARAGTRLVEIEETLAKQNQMLAWEPPHFGPNATLGGAIACGLSGPRRYQTGSCSDFVLGCVMFDATGQRLRFGGEVMKNVAGFDMSRLMVGSMGTLGLLMDLSVKVVPKPAAELTLRHACNVDMVNEYSRQWRSKPIPISGFAWVPSTDNEGYLYLRVSGSQVMLDQVKSQLPGEQISGDEAQAFWLSIKEQSHPFFDSPTLWRVSLPPLSPNLNLGPCLQDWGGSLRWYAASLDASVLRQKVQALGGHATLFKYASVDQIPADGVFQASSATVSKLNQQIKNRLDPDNVFNPHRLFAEF